VHLRRDGLYLLPEARLLGIEKPELRRLFCGLRYRGGGLHRTRRPPGEVVADGDSAAHASGDLADGRVLGSMVGREGVYRHHRRDAVQPDVFDLLAEVVRPGENVVGVFLQEFRRQGPPGDDLEPARVRLKRAHGGDEDGGVGLQPRVAALDVEKRRGAHARTEASLSNEEISSLDPDSVRYYGGVPGCDVAEWASVHQNRRVLE